MALLLSLSHCVGSSFKSHRSMSTTDRHSTHSALPFIVRCLFLAFSRVGISVHLSLLVFLLWALHT
jgi:hypothetical protein